MTKMVYDFDGDKAATEWLGSLKRSTRYNYRIAWKYFTMYAKMTGDQILTDRKEDKEYRWEKCVFGFRAWLLGRGQSENSAKTWVAASRSFFSYHRVPLEFRRSEKARLDEAKRKTEDYRFSREDMRKMVDVADLTEKYALLAGKSFGLRAGDFFHLKRGDLEPYIEREPPISIGEYQTEKEGVKAYPFIDLDAKPVVQNMLKVMGKSGRTSPDEPMLKFKNDIQLSRTLLRLADRAGIQHGSKNVRFHCMRKFLIDHLSSHMSSEKWKQVVGKTISEGAYVSADSLREDYQRAMPETVVMESPLKERLKRTEAVTRIQQKMMADEPLTKEDYADIKRHGIRLTKKRLKPKCDDGEHCQRIATEAELPELLAQGWHVAAALPSGKIVVSNE